MAIARSVSALTRLFPIHAMENVRCSNGVEMATATTKITTAVVVGMAGTVVVKKQRFYTVKTAVVKTRNSRAL